MRDLKEGLERMKRAEQVMSGMKVDTMSIRNLLNNLHTEVETLGK
jgi:hypothetical protein